jgi:ABC-type transporter Mla MlaB component
MGEPAPPEVVICDVGRAPADVATVDTLARLQLAAKGAGRLVRLRNASADLLALVAFMGLTDALPEER